MQRAIILAAGKGTRLRPITNRIPKCLALVDYKPILQHQLEALQEAAIKEAIIVIGYKGDQIKEFLRDKTFPKIKIKLVKNPNEQTNNMFSLYLALKKTPLDHVILMNGDVVFDHNIMKLIASSTFENAIAVDLKKYHKESMKVIVKNGRIIDISKKTPKKKTSGMSIDIYKFSKTGLRTLSKIMRKIIIVEKRVNEWTEVAIEEALIKGLIEVYPVDIQSRFWFEIDSYNDLQLANLFYKKRKVKDILDKTLYIFDLDGTTYVENKLTPGVKDFITYLKKKDKKVVFISNNSSKSLKEYQNKLKILLKMNIKENDIFTSILPTINYIKTEKIKKVFVVGTPSLEDELKRHGIKLTEKDPEAVIIGFDTTLTYEKIKKATLLLRKNLHFIATHSDKVYPAQEGFVPDAGSIISLLETSTNRKPEAILGKPNPYMIQTILKHHKPVKQKKTLIFGDRIYTDIKMGKKAGITTVLVLTGETKIPDLTKMEESPDYIIESFEELSNLVKNVVTLVGERNG